MQSWLGGPYAYDPECGCPMCTDRRDSPNLERPMIGDGGVRLTEDQYTDIVGRLFVIEDFAKQIDALLGPALRQGHDIAHEVKFIQETLEQEHYPVIPEPDTGDPHADDWRPGRW